MKTAGAAGDAANLTGDPPELVGSFVTAMTVVDMDMPNLGAGFSLTDWR